MRPALLLALVVLVPVTGCNQDGSSSPGGAGSPSVAAPTGTAAPAADADLDATPGWAVRRTGHADLDGDGVREEIGYAGEYAPVRFVTTLTSTGETLTARFRLRSISWWPEGYPDLDGDGDREIVLSREYANQRPMVLDLVGDEFVVITHRDPRPLVHGPTVAAQSGVAFSNDWSVHRGRLISYRSVDAFPITSHFFDVPDRFATHRWSWSLDGEHLDATDEGTWCATTASPHPAPCESDLPDLMPEVTATQPASAFPGLVLPHSECGPADVISVRLAGGGWLVRGPGCAESSSFSVHVLVDGAWVVADRPHRPFLGDGIRELAHGHVAVHTWVTADGSLFTRRGRLGGVRQRVWEWSLDGTVLTPTDLGLVCFDDSTRPTLYGTC